VAQKQRTPLYIVIAAKGDARATGFGEILSHFATLRPACVLLDGALAQAASLHNAQDVRVHVHAFGCPCCTGSLPLVVALGRILRHERPKLLIIGIQHSDHRAPLEALIREKFAENVEIGVFSHKSACVAQGLLNTH
jgi:hypothetical protein